MTREGSNRGRIGMNHKTKSTILIVSLLSIFITIALSERATRIEKQRQAEYKALVEKIEKEKIEEKEIKKQLKRVRSITGVCHPGLASIQLTIGKLSTRLREIREARVAFEGPEVPKEKPSKPLSNIEFISRRDEE